MKTKYEKTQSQKLIDYQTNHEQLSIELSAALYLHTVGLYLCIL